GVQVPVSGLLIGAADLAIPQDMDIIAVNGSLQALVSGPFTVEVRRSSDSALIATVNWAALGKVVSLLATPFLRIFSGDSLRFDVTKLGVGALNCYILVWGQTA